MTTVILPGVPTWSSAVWGVGKGKVGKTSYAPTSLRIGKSGCVLAQWPSMDVMVSPRVRSRHILYTLSLPVILPVCVILRILSDAIRQRSFSRSTSYGVFPLCAPWGQVVVVEAFPRSQLPPLSPLLRAGSVNTGYGTPAAPDPRSRGPLPRLPQ